MLSWADQFRHRLKNLKHIRFLTLVSSVTVVCSVQGLTIESLDSIQLCEQLIHHPVRHSRAVVTSARSQRVKLIEKQNTRLRTRGSTIHINPTTS